MNIFSAFKSLYIRNDIICGLDLLEETLKKYKCQDIEFIHQPDPKTWSEITTLTFEVNSSNFKVLLRITRDNMISKSFYQESKAGFWVKLSGEYDGEYEDVYQDEKVS